jgi:2-methylisocitrate lyase-like PEP mutase family enzyme
MVQIQKKRLSRKQLKRNITKRSRANQTIKRGGDGFYNITITTVDHETTYVQRVHPMDTVLTLKKYIYGELGINMEDQRLTFNGSELDDGEIVSESGIQNNSTVYVANISELFTITVTTIDLEATYTPRVHPMDTVLTLKHNIYGWFGINIQDQRITFNGKELFDDEEILSRLGIQENSTVYVADVSDLFTITVRTVDLEESYTPQFHPMDTVFTLKNNIYDWFGIELDDQRITFNDIELDDDEFLSEYGIQENSTIYVEDISQR